MLDALFHLAGMLPLECMEAVFMRQALVALVFLAPMAAVLGVQVVNFRMAFFSDAVSHSAFAGVALGLLAGVDPRTAMVLFGLAVGLGIMALQRGSDLPADTVIGVFFSGMVAFGLAVISRSGGGAGIQQFLYGDILTLSPADILHILLLFAALLLFQILAFNPMLHIGLSPPVARAHGLPAALIQYVFAALLALVVMFAVWGVGVLLVTALLIVPAASARNLARSAAGMFWWAALVSLTSAVAGLLLSAQPWMNTATGATVILAACVWFAVSMVVARLRRPGGTA